ncbi:MAG TPA: class I SAM-dependent methyltransferase [Patescibacteria group bacterium]|nr:class I SAM-dependent methyltransferase [Patescibacteria group bacterium]
MRPSDARWKQGAGYYTESPEQIRDSPLLPDLRRLRDRRILEIFDRHGNLGPGCRVLELGCGRSRWLPFLAVHRQCDVSGLDNETFASELARANLAGAGASGRIVCGDAFDLESNRELLGRFDLIYSMGLLEHFGDVVDRIGALTRYLRPGGRMITTVPNMRGFNWLMQRLGSREILEMHVVYDRKRLARVHEQAGLSTLAAGYAGFFDGYVSAAGGSPRSVGVRLHAGLCRTSSLLAEAWLRTAREPLAPELSWCSPHVYYVGTPADRTGSAPCA